MSIEKLVEECGEALCALIYKEGAWATIDAEDRRLYLRDARAVIRRTLEQLAYTGAISLASIDEGATRPETWKERAENRQAVFLLAKRRAEAADQAAVLSHLHNTETSKMEELTAKGWLAVHELLLRTRTQITKLAMNKFQ